MPTTRIYRASLFLFLAGFLFCTTVQPAAAHAVPEFSTPAPNQILEEAPAEVSILFNEPVVPSLSHIQVLTQSGEAVETGETLPADADNRTLVVSLPPSLQNGAYLVSWQVLSAVDGHTTSGTFSFGVGVAELTAVSEEVTVTAQLSPLSAIARWLTLTGIALLMGLFAFRLIVWNPILNEVDLTQAEETVDRNLARLGIRIGIAGLALIGVGLVLIFIDQARTYDLLQPANLQTWISTRFGAIWLIRFLLIAVSHFNLSLFVDVSSGRRELRGWEWWAGLALALGLSLTSALISHSAALPEDTLQAVLVDWVHVLAATVWVGGLVFLALALWQARRLEAEARTWLGLSLLLNFSGIAAISVGLLIASGSYLAWKHVGGWTELVGTAYGLALVTKIGLALLAFLIAGVNLLFVKPRLNAAYETPELNTAVRLTRRFGWLVRAEALLALLILAAAGVLTDLQRGEDAPLLTDAPGQTTVTQDAEDLTVEMQIEPALVGPNTFDVTITDENGAPVTDAEEVSLRFTFLGQSIGAAAGEAENLGNGRYRLQGSYISLNGTWQVEVSVRRPDAFDTFAAYRLEAGVGGNIRPVDSGVRPLEQFAKFMTRMGGAATGAAMVLFALFWGFVAARAAKTEWQLLPMLAVSLIAFWVGSSQLFTFFTEDYTPAKFTTNPILPDVESVAAGQRLYEENCIQCHGIEGAGNGPLAETLPSPPADFAAGHTDTHPDGDLFYWIREGIEDTPMPAFGDQLTEEETWHLVNYVRRLSAQGATASNP